MNFLKSISDYDTLVFDCDGVILNSNQVKTEAFYVAALAYGEAAANALKNYHVLNGGISRYKKFHYFLQEIVPKYAPNIEGPNYETLLEVFSKYVHESLLRCEIAEGLRELRELTSNTNWLIVSGGDQIELNEIFSLRGLDTMFDGGIFGSPDTKELILAREYAKGNIGHKALFLGDSKYDYEAAKSGNLDFIFLYKWTEFVDYKYFFIDKPVITHKDIKSLL